MKLIYSSRPIGRTNIQVWKPNLFEILANKPNSVDVREAMQRVVFTRTRWGKKYSYTPSLAYKHMLTKFSQKTGKVFHNFADM